MAYRPRFFAPPYTLSRFVRSARRLAVLKRNVFKGLKELALESWRGTRQLEFCWRFEPIPRLRCCDGERPLTEFQTGSGDDIIAVGRISKSRPRWDISDCSQHASQDRMAHGRPPLCALKGTTISRGKRGIRADFDLYIGSLKL